MRDVLETGPRTLRESVTDILHGISVSDPYRWLEDQQSPRTRNWIDQQTQHTRAYFSRIPGRERVRRRIQELLSVEVVDTAQKVGDRIFFRKRAPLQDQPVITMREGIDREDIPLVDPSCLGQTGVSVDITSISRGGKLLAYSVRRGGEDFQAIELMDVDRRERLPDKLPRGLFRGLVFSDDASGFFYSLEEVDSHSGSRRAVCWHKLGTQSIDDTVVFPLGDNPRLQISITGSENSPYIGYMIRHIVDPNSRSLYVQDKAVRTSPRLVADGIEGTFVAKLIGNTAVCLTSLGAPNLRVVAIDLENSQRVNWRTIVPEVDSVIEEFAVAGQTVFVRYLRNGETLVEMYDLFGERRGALPCPKDGTARFSPCDPGTDLIFYQFSSFSQPITVNWYEPLTGRHCVWASRQVPFATKSVHVERREFASGDGARVPLCLVLQERFMTSRPRPALLTCYGGFGVSASPQFSVVAAFLLERGVIYGVANVRGGSEFGGEWHRAGKRLNKPNAINDFICAAEWLTRSGHADPRHLAIGGGSNAGLIVGAAMTRRPDLFRAVLCVGPLLDMLRFQLFDRARNWIEEYGCADNDHDFAVLKSYSPYHNVRPNTAYPAVMLISGDADTRCNPMHARKMTARLQAATTSGYRIILDYKSQWGHIAAQPLGARIDALTDRLSFICHELGVVV